MADGRIYERDIEDLFFKYGKVRDIELKNNRGTIPFAFVRFEDPRDADDAVYGRNGYSYGDTKLRVLWEEEKVETVVDEETGEAEEEMVVDVEDEEEEEEEKGALGKICEWASPHRELAGPEGPHAEAGDVCFADVQRDGEGVVEFLRREDMEYALRRLDRTEFRSHQGETAYIRVYEERGATSYCRSRSRSRSRSRGRYSPPPYQSSSPPQRYQSPPPRHAMSRHSPPSRRPQHHSPPPRHYR
ncbi:unnamed protein product [Gadus morhua 'NCC']